MLMVTFKEGVNIMETVILLSGIGALLLFGYLIYVLFWGDKQ